MWWVCIKIKLKNSVFKRRNGQDYWKFQYIIKYELKGINAEGKKTKVLG